jgi:flagellar biosynthetic protein FlhB
MADESFQDRTEAPTPKRRKDAFDKGQVPRSPEVTTAFLLLAGAGVLASAVGSTATRVVDVFARATTRVTALPAGVEGNVGFLRELGRSTLNGMLPTLLALTGTALVISAIQARGVLSLEPLKPQWSKLDPIKKIPQIWGWKALAELAKSLLKLGLVGLVVWKALGKASSEIPALGQESPFALMDLVQRYAVRILLSAGLAYLVIALADYAFQIWQHEKQLKMSKEEVRREYKEAEGDQVVKVRRRTMARQFARRRMMLAVPEADVVVTNPTHIAVALKYDPDVADAPIVVAMGERKVAERIKEIAREHGVPLIENKPLARALLATARVGAAIPMELFVAVAEILAWVYRQAGYEPGRGHARSGGRG